MLQSELEDFHKTQSVPIEEPQNFTTEEPQDMEFPAGWKIKVNRKTRRANYIPPTGPVLTTMRELITQFPTKSFKTFNRLTGKFEEDHRNPAYKDRGRWLPAAIKLKYPHFDSEPVYLNSILCDYFGFREIQKNCLKTTKNFFKNYVS